MHIQFERSGGFAGIRLATEVESDSLPAEEAQALLSEIQAAGFFSLPPVIPSPGKGADRFEYRLTVQAGDQEHTVQVGEAGMPEGLRPLVEHLSLLARTRRSMGNDSTS